MKPNEKERSVRKTLERMFGTPLPKRKLVVGYDSNNFPRIHQFDLVSDDSQIVGEIKASKKDDAGVNYDSALADCFYLTKVKAKKKIFALTDFEFYEYFREKSNGIIASDIEVIFVPVENY